MSTVLSFKKHPPKNRSEEIDWKVMEISDLLKLYLDDHKKEHLISAEYDLTNLVDFVVNRHDPRNPPF